LFWTRLLITPPVCILYWCIPIALYFEVYYRGSSGVWVVGVCRVCSQIDAVSILFSLASPTQSFSIILPIILSTIFQLYIHLSSFLISLLISVTSLHPSSFHLFANIPPFIPLFSLFLFLSLSPSPLFYPCSFNMICSPPLPLSYPLLPPQCLAHTCLYSRGSTESCKCVNPPLNHA
jgi:hypothetical protein